MSEIATAYVNVSLRLAQESLNQMRAQIANVAKGAQVKMQGAGGGITQAFSGMQSSIKSAFSSMPQLGMLTKLAGIAGFMALLYESSKTLQRSVGGILKAVSLIVRPIGDILGMALMPIVGILRPIGMIFNLLFKPYRQQIMQAMRAGNTLMRSAITTGNAGEMVQAIAAYGVGFLAMVKPIIDIVSTLLENGMNLYVDMIGKQLNVIVDVINFGMKTMVDMVFGSIDLMLGTIAALARAIPIVGNDIGNSIDKVRSGVSGMATSIKDSIDQTTSDVKTGIAAFVSVGQTTIHDGFVSFNAIMQSGLTNMLTTVTDWAADANAKLKAQLTGYSSLQTATPGQVSQRSGAGGITYPFEDLRNNPVYSGYYAALDKALGKQTGGDIPQDDFYYLHRGEEVINATSRDRGTINNFTPYITINAKINKDIDIKQLAQQLTDEFHSELRRKTSYR